jgi:hypothetical protein
VVVTEIHLQFHLHKVKTVVLHQVRTLRKVAEAELLNQEVLNQDLLLELLTVVMEYLQELTQAHVLEHQDLHQEDGLLAEAKVVVTLLVTADSAVAEEVLQ